MKKRRLCILATTLLLVAVIGSGATAAYSTDSEKVENTFNFTSAALEVQEPSWDKLLEMDRIAYPGRKIDKDPHVVNTGDVPMYVYLEIKVPKATCRTVQADGVTLSEPTLQRIILINGYSPWRLIDTDYTNENFDVCIFAYCEGALLPGDKTTNIFNYVKVIDFVEGDVDIDTLELPIRAFGIQSNYIPKEGNNIIIQMKNIYVEHKSVLQN